MMRCLTDASHAWKALDSRKCRRPDDISYDHFGRRGIMPRTSASDPPSFTISMYASMVRWLVPTSSSGINGLVASRILRATSCAASVAKTVAIPPWVVGQRFVLFMPNASAVVEASLAGACRPVKTCRGWCWRSRGLALDSVTVAVPYRWCNREKSTVSLS
eukprot:9228970-Pyramimonas_sp.AAC.1